MLLFLCVLTTFAQVRTDTMIVKVNGVLAGASRETINIVQLDGQDQAIFNLEDFKLKMGDQTLFVGNIVIPSDMDSSPEGYTSFYAKKSIKIQPGSDASIPWIGPSLGEIPVDLIAKQDEDEFLLRIHINLPNMVVEVIFGQGYQVNNSDFEFFHTAKAGKYTSDEPNGWHSFTSATGSYKGFVNTNVYTTISNDVRPGSLGKHSVAINGHGGFISSNGTLTTGRLQAAGFSTTSTDNCSFLDLSKTDLDDNGDPFEARIKAVPDSLVAWVKFTQGKGLSHPYAIISAFITDGTYYQQPENTTYNNVRAVAIAHEIADTKGQWTRISVPFKEHKEGVTPRAILITCSTNAQPAVATDQDTLWVDDMEMIYNTGLKKIAYNGKVLDGFSTDKTEYEVSINGTNDDDNMDVEALSPDMMTVITEDKAQSKVYLTVYNADLSASKQYVLKLISLGIADLKENVTPVQYYRLDGTAVHNVNRSGVYLIKMSDGTMRKALVK